MSGKSQTIGDFTFFFYRLGFSRHMKIRLKEKKIEVIIKLRPG